MCGESHIPTFDLQGMDTNVIINMPKVSVISPIFGVEKFIEKGARSMMEQTLDDVEFIFVDDCSQDASIQILEDVLAQYPERKDQVKIVRHSENKGLPSARNSGLEIASGDYIFHWDSDDYAEISMLKEMYEFATNNNLDIVWADWYLTFSKNERYMSQPDFVNPEEAIKAMLGGRMKYNVWNKLARRSLYFDNQIRFPDGYGMGEDLTMILLFLYAEKTGHISKAYYHYIKINNNAFSHGVNPLHFETLKVNVNNICKKIISIKGQDMEKDCLLLKLDSKYPLIACTSDYNNYKIWQNWFPESNMMIESNRKTSKRRMLLERAALRKVYPFLWLHSKILNFYYGFIYR